ncbi:MAG TPA: tRNA-dihydrouridine synthase family protein [Kiritimatiellia bacterium]|jgi:tRNA-dihydrouridine synthase|nr:tRNA-dihydrouridine synthase family protein [Kiritimatiellia bacterium]HPK37753.1 tRNA-dihydrouridine synthase family protein [Kiritimatiellia bacterium]
MKTPLPDTLPSDTFCLAPLRGVTVRAFRALHARWFTPPDYAVAPFIPTFAGGKVKRTLLKDIDPALGQAVPVVPQVIGKEPLLLRTLLQVFKSMGYDGADLNAGCPYPFIVKKGRGAGLMRDAGAFARMLEAGCEEMPQGFSVKVRLGIDRPDLLMERMEVINAFPLREVTIHARTARQMYAGRVDLAAFEEARRACRHPVVYNGDLCTRADFLLLKTRFPMITRWMIGRGAAVDPFVFGRLTAEASPPRDAERLKRFLDEYLDACLEELHGPASVLGRLKELWGYLHRSLAGGGRVWKRVRVCRTVDEYRRVVEESFGRAFPGFVEETERNGFGPADRGD